MMTMARPVGSSRHQDRGIGEQPFGPFVQNRRSFHLPGGFNRKAEGSPVALRGVSHWKGLHMRRFSICCFATLALILGVAVSGSALPADIDEFKVKRQEVFEFTEKPAVTRDGDKVTIRFTSKAFCDATVAIEDGSGGEGQPAKIVRHLASGVLGSKAPAPFQKDSLTQVVAWDGKDDQGKYLDARAAAAPVVRVSLGLRPQFERTLLWEPHKRSSNGWGGANATLVRAAPEGVYVYDTGAFDHLRLFDHDGNYVRTIYPFAADKLDKIVGLPTHTFPQDGKTLPFKSGFQQSTLLFGRNAATQPMRTESGFNATAMAVANGRIALAGRYVSRLATDGTSGGLGYTGNAAWDGGGCRCWNARFCLDYFARSFARRPATSPSPCWTAAAT